MPSIAAPDNIASANEQYGQLKANLHIASYTLERAFRSFLEPLLTGDTWRLCGSGYSNVNAFMESLRLDKFRVIAEERKAIVQRIKKLQPAVSNRQIARTLGVGNATIDRDVAPNGAASKQEPNDINTSNVSGAPTGADTSNLSELSGAEVARMAARRERSAPPHHAIEPVTMPVGQFSVLLADPPWRYENPPMGGSNRSIENHYPTMSLSEICAMPDQGLVPAADNAMLYLWATAPKLAECFEVITAWGFTYRTNLVWVKDKIGMGYHARSQHELLLVAKRGELPPPLPQDRVSSVVIADRGDHSKKPEVFYELIERWYPALSKVELFAREPREGWASWGNQLIEAAQ